MKKHIKIPIIFFAIILIVFCVLSYLNPKIAEKKRSINIAVGECALDGSNCDRYQDMLIMYDTAYERNEYGYELLVEKDSGFVIDQGVILELSDNTFILSGNGIAADFLMSISIGDIVEVDEENNVKITRSLYRSNLKMLEIRDEAINEVIDYKTENLYDIDNEEIDRLDIQIKDARNDFRRLFFKQEIDPYEINKQVEEIIELIDSKYLCTIESRSIELRGLWHRPNKSGISEKDLDGVREFVDSLSKLGINTLYVETFWHGMTTYYSDYLGLAHPQMARYTYGEYGNDYMLALISECHKAGIEVHAWFETLSISTASGKINDYINPEWVVYDLDGKKSDFADPSNPEVKEFLLNIISEMLEKYDFDGISYDYIRYSEAGDFDGYCDSGFSANAIALFKEEYGYTGDDLLSDVVSDENVRGQWHKFKQDAVSSLVGAMTQHIRAINPDIIISVSPYGHVEHAKSMYMQDVEFWCDMGYVDVVLPMIFTDNLEFYCETVESFNEFSDMVIQAPGNYSLYNGDSLLDAVKLLEAVSARCLGNSIFASQNVISDSKTYAAEVLSVLSSSTHESGAISPTADVNLVVEAWATDILDKCDRIYKKRMSEEELDLIKGFCLNSLNVTNDVRSIADLMARLDSLKISLDSFSDSAVKARLNEQIDYLKDVLDHYITRYLISHGYWNPGTTEDRPDVYGIVYHD